MSSRRSVLIVDDDDAVRAGLASILESEEVDVKTAATLQEAEGLLSMADFDVVMTDLRLSGPSCYEGWEVIRRVKGRSPRTHVVLFTAFGTEEIEQAAKRLGAAACWSKSIPIPEIISRIRALGIPVGPPGRGR
jgi:CheY-like chemotaxis protein